MTPGSFCVPENALGHVTVDEWLSGMRSTSGSGGNATVTIPNGPLWAPSVLYMLMCDIFLFI